MTTPLDLQGRHIVLGLSGGIACYKSAELARGLIKAGATVQVVMSEAAEQFITAVTLQALTNRHVYTSQWDTREPNAMAHINLTRNADAVLIAPASADLMAKLVQGCADELLSLMCLARPIERCPLLLAPAMNREMWAHPATQRNVALARADGARILGPGAGDQACGEIGDGRDVITDFQDGLDRISLEYEGDESVAGLNIRNDGILGTQVLVACPYGFAVRRAQRPVRRRSGGGRAVLPVGGRGPPGGGGSARSTPHRPARARRSTRYPSPARGDRAHPRGFVVASRITTALPYRPRRFAGARAQPRCVRHPWKVPRLRRPRIPAREGRGPQPVRTESLPE